MTQPPSLTIPESVHAPTGTRHSVDTPPRILYLIDTLEIGGAEKSLALILTFLTQVEPFLYHLYAGDTLRSRFQASGIRVETACIEQKYAPMRAIRNVVRFVRANHITLIHSMLFRSDIAARIAGRIAGIPVINTLVNDSYASVRFAHLSPRTRQKMKIIQAIDKTTAPLTFHFVANSAAIKSANAQNLHIPPAKISVIYRGRDPESYAAPSQEETQRLRSALAIPPDAPVLLNVGRLALAKNQAELIRAMPAVLQHAPDCRLLVAGEGPLRSALEALIAESALSESVQLLGNRDDIPALLHASDGFVFPSLFEGHPGALVEAMFAARPIVASAIPVHAETLLDGQAGALVPLGDVESLAQAIVDLLRNPAHAATLGQCARATALERFDIRRIAAQHEALYADVLQSWRAAQ